MIFEKMQDINRQFNITNMGKKEARKLLRDNRFPSWCQRQSDLPTWKYLEIARHGNYKAQEQEQFRQKNGYLSVHMQNNYWMCEPVLTKDFLTTERGEECQSDFQRMLKEGNPYINQSSVSSEKRHAIAVAKAASVLYELAFAEDIDVEVVDVRKLQSSERRMEIYKFFGRMGVDDSKEAPIKPEKKEDEKVETKSEVHIPDVVSQIEESHNQTSASLEEKTKAQKDLEYEERMNELVEKAKREIREQIGLK